MSQKEPGTLIVCRGSNANIDPDAQSLSSGHSQIKAFNIANLTSTTPPYDFNWTNGATGPHTVAAMAYSNAGVRNCYAVTLNEH